MLGPNVVVQIKERAKLFGTHGTSVPLGRMNSHDMFVQIGRAAEPFLAEFTTCIISLLMRPRWAHRTCNRRRSSSSALSKGLSSTRTFLSEPCIAIFKSLAEVVKKFGSILIQPISKEKYLQKSPRAKINETLNSFSINLVFFF